MEEKRINGILHLTIDSKEFIDQSGEEEGTLGVKLSMDWELDRITLSIVDAKGASIGCMVFDSSEFQSAVDKGVMPPNEAELKKQSEEVEKMSEDKKKELEESAKEDSEAMAKNPVKDEISQWHDEKD